MKVVALTNGDVVINGIRTALFAEQAYDLPKAEAEKLIKAGRARSAEKRTKAVKGPPEDK